MQIFINVIGHNASGKSFLSKKLSDKFGLNRVSGDDLREFVCGHVKYFASLDLSYPQEKYKVLNSVILNYRFSMTWVLLDARQNVLLEGSGVIREHRAKYLDKIKADFPDVKRVLIWTDIPEHELLKRLAERDKKLNGRWTDQYVETKKAMFEPPTEDEADLLLVYSQTNYDEIEAAIKKLLD